MNDWREDGQAAHEYGMLMQERDADTRQHQHTLNGRTKGTDMALMASNTGGNFEMCPEGVHPARCYRIIDLGTQKSEYQGQAKQSRKVMIGWELLGEERMEDGRPFSVNKRYTLSLHEKAQLRKDLEAWRGKAFTLEEEAGFDIAVVLGAPCLLNIVHEKGNNGNEYANISSIMPIPKGMPKPDGVNEPVLFEIGNPDMKLYESFSDKLKATIQAAPEWNKPVMQKQRTDGGLSDMDEDIPF